MPKLIEFDVDARTALKKGVDKLSEAVKVVVYSLYILLNLNEYLLFYSQ